MMNPIKCEIINIIAKLDNGSHSSNQLQGAEEALFKLVEQIGGDLVEENKRLSAIIKDADDSLSKALEIMCRKMTPLPDSVREDISHAACILANVVAKEEALKETK